MQVPEYWRSPDNHLYRICRERTALVGEPGQVFTVRAVPLGSAGVPAEASSSLREVDLHEMVTRGQLVPTPEQLFQDAFRQLTARLGRA